MDWVLKRDYTNESRFKRYSKKHREEVVSCATNLERLREYLNNGGSLVNAASSFGYFRSEGENVYRIGQTAVRHAKETRLYIYAKISGPDIQVLTIGDKDTQSDDINWCHQVVRKIQTRKENQENESTD